MYNSGDRVEYVYKNIYSSAEETYIGIINSKYVNTQGNQLYYIKSIEGYDHLNIKEDDIIGFAE